MVKIEILHLQKRGVMRMFLFHPMPPNTYGVLCLNTGPVLIFAKSGRESEKSLIQFLTVLPLVIAVTSGNSLSVVLTQFLNQSFRTPPINLMVH